MKKLILTFLLFLSMISTSTAPPSNMLIVPEITFKVPRIVYYDAGFYEDLINALYKYEAKCNPFAYNPVEEATGGLQIRPIRLAHYNELTNSNYTIEDCYNFEISKKIFLYFCNHDGSGKLIPWKTWEQAAKDWNGSGPMTITYWENVKQLI